MSKDPKSPQPSDILIEHFSDRSIRRLLQYPEYVRGLVEIIAPELVALLDFSRGVQQNRSFISDALRERESDVLLQVPFQGTPDSEELLIYILIEHQSTVDPTMGFRLLSYMMEIWQEQWRAWQSETGMRRRLDPILPIVFYTGDRRWASPLSLTAIMEVPEILKRFVPTFDTLFLGVKTVDRETLTKPGHPLGWLLSVLQKEGAEKSAISDALVAAVSELGRLDETQVSQVRQALLYFIQLILHRRPAGEREELIELVKRHSQDESEVAIMAQTAAELLIEQGKAEGIIEGKQAAILQLLRLRFQNVPETFTERITSIENLSYLDMLLEQTMTAENLDEIQI
ncbi:Rpn family recombination-promoting nuclease/putative transposase [Candidatus Poribacteria bacterium]|nr:Rpn family recombination-promoting nuclease/putative transposase [Candidatus Poribacteria bacterium]